MGLGNMLLNGETLEIIESNGYIIIRALGDNQKLLIIDPETGLVMDGATPSNDTICGSFCYSDLQTEWATDLAESILGLGTSIFNILSGGSIIDFSHLATNTRTGITGFIGGALISLSWANFMVNNVYSNSISTVIALNGLVINNVFVDYIGGNTYVNEHTTIAGSFYTPSPVEQIMGMNRGYGTLNLNQYHTTPGTGVQAYEWLYGEHESTYTYRELGKEYNTYTRPLGSGSYKLTKIPYTSESKTTMTVGWYNMSVWVDPEMTIPSPNPPNWYLNMMEPALFMVAITNS